jgi:hypothetical protein
MLKYKDKKGGDKMTQVHGMTDFQFQKHLADTLLILENAREEITQPCPQFDKYLEILRGQVKRP